MAYASRSALLINSPLFRDSTPATDEDYLPSLGLGILTRTARSAGIRVDYIDAIYEKRSVLDLINTIDQGPWDTVALNVFTVNQHLVRDIVQTVSRRTQFILGGLATRALLPTIASWNTSNTIHVVFGDGEFIFPLLIMDANSITPSKSTNHVHYHEVNTRSDYYVRDISEILPDRTIFSNEPYQNIHGMLEASIVTSRGCIYNCAFCGAARSLNKDFSVREASVESVRGEVDSISQRYPSIQTIRVLDDLYLKNRESVLRAIDVFCQFPLEWRAMAHVASIRQVTDQDLRELRRSGCSELFIGVESGSPEVLRRIHKTSDTRLIVEQISRLFAAGIAAKCYFIFGFPGETEADMQLSLDLARRLLDQAAKCGGLFRTSVFQFRPYDGTELYHIAKQSRKTIVERDARFDRELTARIGRAQYNFEAGNFSEVRVELVRDFIAMAARLQSSR